jgi:hypothetical protein
VLRVLSELLWAVRRAGIDVSTAQAIDAARAVRHVGWGDRTSLRLALRASIVTRRSDLATFDRAFDDFFREESAHAVDLFGRLRAAGFSAAEVDALWDVVRALSQRTGDEVTALGPLVRSPAEIDHLLAAAGLRRLYRSVTGPPSVGYFAQKAAGELGVTRAASALARIEDALADAIGRDRAAALRAALRDELDALRRRVRARVELEAARRDRASPRERPSAALDVPFDRLGPEEAADVRRALRRLADRLRGAARIRARRTRKGKVDPRRTLRRAQRTGGVPMVLSFRDRPRDRPRLLVVCDVSDSVRPASRFMLEFVAAVQDLFAGARSFVFVSDVAETTSLFRGRSTDRALAALASGSVVSLSASSHYGRALAEVERRVARGLDRRTTIVLLGDGRTNMKAHGAEIVRRLRDRARGVLWLCPEPRASWGLGDSMMPRFAEASTEVLAVRSGRELEEAAARLVRFR